MKRPHWHPQRLHRCPGADAEEGAVVRLPFSGLTRVATGRAVGGVSRWRALLSDNYTDPSTTTTSTHLTRV